ncbi:hypothetical protein BC939DRAFT_458871 [Gamsiella multidivaricata]|uniref:uncharacterized protein n=1 Tax=Gamsiella multidivaricata TaxID=101098 RepID=UPI002220CD12|nr:uncharacterized protein BC939DRAFT_458871 [Gamsiella multidivaricata]KAI7820077.1 hypothetical protein BC939DRAFT_458871 [Gamsiella multidivaricata]
MTHHTDNKPSTMDTIKDKAANLVNKVTGKTHDDTTGTHHTGIHDTTATGIHKDHNPLHKDHNPLHTGAATADYAAPQGNTADRLAYQPQTGVPAPVTGTQTQGGHHHRGAEAAALGATGAAVAGHHHEHNKHNLGTNVGTTGATGVPGTYNNNTALGVNNSTTTAVPGGGIAHPVPAGPTGTSQVPTYAQNIAPVASGVVPTAYAADQQTHEHKHHGILGHHNNNNNNNNNTLTGEHHRIHPGAEVAAAGTTAHQYDNNYNNNVPSSTTTNTVPAMGAPGTTTAAGTHIPGEYNTTGSSGIGAAYGAGKGVGTQNIPGDYNTANTTANNAINPNSADRGRYVV